MDPVVVVAIAIHHAGERGKGQIEAVHRMAEKQGKTFRPLYGLEIM
jgi:hypothetical protein